MSIFSLDFTTFYRHHLCIPKRSITLATIAGALRPIPQSILFLFHLDTRTLEPLKKIHPRVAGVMATLNTIMMIISSTYRQDIAFGTWHHQALLHRSTAGSPVCPRGPPARRAPSPASPLSGCEVIARTEGLTHSRLSSGHALLLLLLLLLLLNAAVVLLVSALCVPPSPHADECGATVPLLSLCCLKIRDLGFFIFSPPCNLLQSS